MAAPGAAMLIREIALDDSQRSGCSPRSGRLAAL
jgi:hypothetical protein